jgi:hypothetical protein
MANKDCKQCNGTGKKWYVVGRNDDGTSEVDNDICDCVLEEGEKYQEQERIKTLLKDIQDLSEKLLYVATKTDVKDKTAHKIEIRDLRAMLKDKLATFEVIEQSRKMFDYWGGGSKW